MAAAMTGWVALGALASAAHANSIDRGLVGAWTTYATDCEKIFQWRGSAVSFRQPIDKFAQAVIIEPQQIQSPAYICSVGTVKRDEKGYTITGECKDSISYTPANLHIRIQSPNTMVYSPSADPALDTTLVKCHP